MTTARAATAPAPLRILHAIVFLGFASTAIAATHVELLHLVRSLLHPFNSGTPPQVLPCVSGAASILLSLMLLVRFSRRRSVILISVLMLAAFGLSFTTLLGDPEQRSAPGANVKAIEAATKLHGDVNGVLQGAGKAPRDPSAPPGTSPYRTRAFASLPWHVALVASNTVLPAGAAPGWLLLHVSDDQASFSITTVGLDRDGQPALLRDDGGEPIELKGAYNPDTPE